MVVIFVILLMDEIKSFCISARGIYMRDHTTSGNEGNGCYGCHAPVGAALSVPGSRF